MKQFEAQNFYVQSVDENNLHLIKKVYENIKTIRIVAQENSGADQSGKRTVLRDPKTRDMSISSDLPFLSSLRLKPGGLPVCVIWIWVL